jgi:hypothetical protein
MHGGTSSETQILAQTGGTVNLQSMCEGMSDSWSWWRRRTPVRFRHPKIDAGPERYLGVLSAPSQLYTLFAVGLRRYINERLRCL